MQSSSEKRLPKSIQITQDDKFISKLLSRETSIGSSSRVYYTGNSGSIPFTWETLPGTSRKLAVPRTPDKPLTPPPAYYSTDHTGRLSSCQKSSSKSRFLKTLFSPKNSKDAGSCDSTRLQTSSSESPSVHSSSFSGKRSSSCSGSLSSFDEKVDLDAEEEMVIATCKSSVLTCLGIKKGSQRRGGAAPEKKVVSRRSFLSCVF